MAKLENLSVRKPRGAKVVARGSSVKRKSASKSLKFAKYDAKSVRSVASKHKKLLNAVGKL